MPDNFIPMGVTVAVTTAATNAVNLVDIGTDADTDGFVDGITAAVNSTGFKDSFLAMEFLECLVELQLHQMQQQMK